jgi:N-acetylglutamate synthase-like GNAT family acetyltransferase
VVAAAAQAASADGAVGLYLLTRDARGFFEGLGFEALEREKAPRWIREGESAQRCEQGAALMRRGLKGRSSRRDLPG